MDARLYIFSGVLVLLVVLLAYLFVALWRYRRAVRQAKAWQSQVDTAAGSDSVMSAAMSPASTFPDVTEVLGAPLRTGDWMPDAPRSARERSPENRVDAEQAVVVSGAVVRETFVAEMAATPIEPMPISQPAPEPVPAPAPEPEPALAPAPEPAPEPALDLGRAPDVQLQPHATAHARRDEVAPALRIPETRPLAVPLPVVVHSQPAEVALSVGNVLSSAGQVSAPSDIDSAQAEVSALPNELEYHLVAPVELQFTTGGGRVGVRPGSRAFGEFQRLAGLLLADLADPRSGAVPPDGQRIP